MRESDQLGEGARSSRATYMVLVDRSNKFAVFLDLEVPDWVHTGVAVGQQTLQDLGALLELDTRSLLISTGR